MTSSEKSEKSLFWLLFLNMTDTSKIFNPSEDVIQLVRFTPLQPNHKRIPIEMTEKDSVRKVTLVRRAPLQMRFFDIFNALHNHLIIGFLMSTEIFEFWPKLCLWQLFKEGNHQQIFTDFEHPFSNDHISGLEWTFSKIPKPRINSLACSSSRKRTQVREGFKN